MRHLRSKALSPWSYFSRAPARSCMSSQSSRDLTRWCHARSTQILWNTRCEIAGSLTDICIGQTLIWKVAIFGRICRTNRAWLRKRGPNQESTSIPWGQLLVVVRMWDQAWTDRPSCGSSDLNRSLFSIIVSTLNHYCKFTRICKLSILLFQGTSTAAASPERSYHRWYNYHCWT